MLVGVAAESQCNMFTIVADYTAKGFSLQSVSPAKRNKCCCSSAVRVQSKELQSFGEVAARQKRIAV